MPRASPSGRPRRIAIFLANLAGGHRSVAAALQEALLAQEPGLHVEVIDVFSECSRFPLTAIPKLYNLFTARWRFLWDGLYHATNSPGRYHFAESLARPFLQRGLDRVVREGHYDVLVTVFPALGRSLAHARGVAARRPALIALVIDLVTIHPAWICSDMDWYLVPTAQARQACLRYGITPERVLTVGLPIRAEFAGATPTQREARCQLGLEPDTFTVLLMGGGEGSGRLRDLASLLVESAPALQVLIVTGRNARLRRQLEVVPGRPSVRVFGYVDDILPLMAACDLVVSKAGPCTIAEAVACHRPLLLTGHLPQEEGNVLWVCEQGLGWAVAGTGAIQRHILSLAHGGNGDLQEMQHTAGGAAWYRAAAQAADWVLKCSG